MEKVKQNVAKGELHKRKPWLRMPEKYLSSFKQISWGHMIHKLTIVLS